jgi:alcohol dehydrogenase
MKLEDSPTVAGSARGSQESMALPAFDFRPLTRVVYGAGTLARLGDLILELGGSSVLLVTDPGIEAAGHPQRAFDCIKQAGLPVVLFDGVEENPSDRHVNSGLAVAQRHGVDFLVAIGGGSSMDCAKGINFLLTNGGNMADYQGFGKASRVMLPSIGIPSTAGTGSEAQSYALIADEKTHMKMACGDPKVAFRVAILDPEVTVSQPPKVTAITAIDALSHALESYVTRKRNPLAQMFAREAWKLLEPGLERVLNAPRDLDARGSMQLGAHFAGLAIENSMLGACHACANPLTAHYGLTHGIAIGVMLPHVIRFNADAVGGLYEELVHGGGMLNGNQGAAAEALAQRIIGFMNRAGLPTTLSAYGIEAGILPLLAEEASDQWTGQFNPRPVDQNALRGLYEKAL